MGLQINPALPAALGRRASEQAGQVQRGLGQLASGLRIDRAAVDAAGLAIAENLRASVRQLNAEVQSLQNGISLAQTAEGALDAQSDTVQRIGELALQASNGTLSNDQRAAINAEAQQLVAQLDDTAQSTSFNGLRPLSGETESVSLDAEGQVSIELQESTAESLGLSDIDLSTAQGASAAVGAANQARDRIDTARSNLGAQQSELEATIRNREDRAVDEAEAESRIRDLDVARAIIEQTLNEVRRDIGIAAAARGNLEGETALRLLGG